MLAHLRSECYPMYQQTFYEAGTMSGKEDVTVTDQENRIDEAKRRLGYLQTSSSNTEGLQDLMDRSIPRRSTPKKGKA